MNSSTKLLAVFLCGAALAACKAVEDHADDAPVYPNPAVTVAISGQVSGLGRLRPVILNVQTQTPTQTEPVSRELSVRDTDTLRFGAVPIGSTYNITVAESPYARTCTIANGSGTATVDVVNVTVTCLPSNVPRFTLSTSINSTLAANLPEGFAITLTTEDGSETIVPAAGQTQVTFSLPILYPGGNNPPPFSYAVTATNQAGGTTNNCVVANASGEVISGTSNITNPSVTSCVYTVSANVRYSPTPECRTTLPAGQAPNTNCATPIPQGPTVAIHSSGVQLGLRNQITGETVAQAPLVTAAGTVQFPGSFASNANALYEVFVQTHPTGQHCITAQTPVFNNSRAAASVASITAANNSGGKVNLVNSFANTTVHIRCRNIPATANQLKGVYQLDTPPINVSSGAAVAPESRFQLRNFLTFFPNGTFLYGSHPSEAASGVEHGFYNYDPVARTLQFTVHTDTNTVNLYGGTAGVTAAFNAGLSGRAGYALTTQSTAATGTDVRTDLWLGAVTAINVVHTPGAVGVPGTLSMTFGSAVAPVAPATTPVAYRVPTWTMTEPRQTLGQIQGTWATADSLRVFVYDDLTYYGFHAGMNGAPNLQDVCLVILDPRLAASYYTRRGGGTGCMQPGNEAPASAGVVSVSIVDVPSASQAATSTANSTAYFIPGFKGRFPGTQSTQVSSTSPVNYTVTPGNPDTLFVENTLNGIPTGDDATFYRITTY